MVLVKASETDLRFPELAFVSGGETTAFPHRWWRLLHNERL